MKDKNLKKMKAESNVIISPRVVCKSNTNNNKKKEKSQPRSALRELKKNLCINLSRDEVCSFY